MWSRVKHLHDGDLGLQDLREQDRPPLLVPATSIYSRTDGVAPWQTCIDEVREHAENIEVRGSHIGMGLNPAVVVAVLDRLDLADQLAGFGDQAGGQALKVVAAPQGIDDLVPRPSLH